MIGTNNLGGGIKVFIDGVKKLKGDLNLITKNILTVLGSISYSITGGSIAVLNGIVHILGSAYYSSSYAYAAYHYKWNGSAFVSASTIPYNFYNGSAVVRNGEIHLLGGQSKKTNHYKWSGSAWTSVSTLPRDFYRGAAVALGSEIHILGGSSSMGYYHNIWDGTSWGDIIMLPVNFEYGAAVVLDGEVHILGGDSDTDTTKYHYKYSNGAWTQVSTLPITNFYSCSACVFQNQIYIFSDDSKAKCYRWDGSTWIKMDLFPGSIGRQMIVADDSTMHIMSGQNYFISEKGYKEVV